MKRYMSNEEINRCFAGWTGTTEWRWTTSGHWRRRRKRSWTRRGARERSGGPRALSRSCSSMDHPGLDQRINSMDKHQEHPWKTRVVSQSNPRPTFKETVVRQGWIIETTLEKEVVDVKQSDRISMLCQQTKLSRQTMFNIWDICNGGEICKEGEGRLNNRLLRSKPWESAASENEC